MKKILVSLIATILTIGTAAARDKVYHSTEPLPEAAKTMLATHFPKASVNHVKVEGNIFTSEYEVILNDGTEVDFNKNGEWKSIDRGRQEIPSALVPTTIRDFLKKNYPGAKITDIDKSRNEYEIALSSVLELKFDRAGNFKRIDD